MADNLDNLSAWRLVLALGRTGSLTQAAVAADIELSAASRLLTSLEKSLGIQLVDRKTKPMRFHPNAKPLLSKIEEMLDLHRDLIEQADRLSESEARITIRFSVPTNIARRFFVLLMDRYKQEVDPNVDFEFFSNLDHVDVQNGLVDMAMLPYCPVNVSGLHVQPFLPATTLIVASPAYLEEHGTPERVEDLVHHRLLIRTGRHYPVTTRLFSLDEMFDFETLKRQPLPNKLGLLAREAYGGPVRKKNRQLSTVYGDCMTCYQSALSGMGIAIDLSLGVIDEALKAGQLVPVLKEWHRPLWRNSLVIRERNLLNEDLMRFMNWFATEEGKEGRERWMDWYRKFGLNPEAVLERGY